MVQDGRSDRPAVPAHPQRFPHRGEADLEPPGQCLVGEHHARREAETVDPAPGPIIRAFGERAGRRLSYRGRSAGSGACCAVIGPCTPGDRAGSSRSWGCLWRKPAPKGLLEFLEGGIAAAVEVDGGRQLLEKGR